MSHQPNAKLDSRFSEPGVGATPWPDALRLLESAGSCIGSPLCGSTVDRT